MKKIIALLLALIMTFSVATVAFATEGSELGSTLGSIEIPDDIVGTLEETLGDYAWILDLPFETVGPALWFAKMALKFVIAYVSICNKLGLDPKETATKIFEFIGNLVEEYKPAGDATEEVVPAIA